MTRLQVVVLALFALVTFANTFLQQPGVDLQPMLRAGLVALNVTMFFAALNLKQFAELGRSSHTPELIAPPAPDGAVESILEAPPAAQRSNVVIAVKPPTS